jgi:uncharacterized protein
MFITLKVIGQHADDFEALVLELIQRHIKPVDESALSRRLSRNGKYLAVHVTLLVESKLQYDNLYRELNSHERVIMVL